LNKKNSRKNDLIDSDEDFEEIKKIEYPKHWGAAPKISSSEVVELLNGYGFGSPILAIWIQKNLERDT
jgi:hypothetical protein